MTHQQWEAVERSLSDLSTEDKLELVERLVHELRVAESLSDSPTQHPEDPRTEHEFKQNLLKSGLITALPIPCDPASRPLFEPVTLEGEPLSETVIRERR